MTAAIDDLTLHFAWCPDHMDVHTCDHAIAALEASESAGQLSDSLTGPAVTAQTIGRAKAAAQSTHLLSCVRSCCVTRWESEVSSSGDQHKAMGTVEMQCHPLYGLLWRHVTVCASLERFCGRSYI